MHIRILCFLSACLLALLNPVLAQPGSNTRTLFDVALNKKIQQIDNYDAFDKQQKEFESLSKKDPNNWTYTYYKAFTHLYTYYFFTKMSNAGEKKRMMVDLFGGDKLDKTGEPFERYFLTLAIDEINTALKKEKHPELYNLKAYLCFLFIKPDKEALFPPYQKEIETCIAASETNDPSNLNFLVVKTLLNYYGPEHIYGGIDNALNLANEAKALYPTLNQTTPNLPNWSEKALDDHLGMLEKMGQ